MFVSYTLTNDSTFQTFTPYYAIVSLLLSTVFCSYYCKNQNQGSLSSSKIPIKNTVKVIWDKIFKNGPSRICERQPSKKGHVNYKKKGPCKLQENTMCKNLTSEFHWIYACFNISALWNL